MISNGEIVIGILIFVLLGLLALYQRSRQPAVPHRKDEHVPRHW